MNEMWKKVIFDILKFAIGSIVGAIGMTATGCACVPQFIF